MESRPRAAAIARCICSGGWSVTLRSLLPAPGSMVYERSIPSPAYCVKVSPSTMVITVSRCMNARPLGMSSATIVLAEPASKSRCAILSTAWGVVRSLIPISTAPCRIQPTSTSSAAPADLAQVSAARSSSASRGAHSGWAASTAVASGQAAYGSSSGTSHRPHRCEVRVVTARNTVSSARSPAGPPGVAQPAGERGQYGLRLGPGQQPQHAIGGGAAVVGAGDPAQFRQGRHDGARRQAVAVGERGGLTLPLVVAARPVAQQPVHGGTHLRGP
ncbi:hypothetical protein SANTM175S_06697 [Streptomyces antimycoticus]